MRRKLIALVAALIVTALSIGLVRFSLAKPATVSAPPLHVESQATPPADDMWVVLDPGHGYTYGSDAPHGTYTGFQANGLIEDLEVYDILSRAQEHMRALPEPILTARDRVAPYQGAHGEQNVADWDADKTVWTGVAPVDANGDLHHSVAENKIRANYDRAAFANSRAYGGHNPGRIFISLHLDARKPLDSNRGTIIFSPCFDAAHQGAEPPYCAGNQAQYDKSVQLATDLCKHISAMPGWPGCRVATWSTDYTVLREIDRNTPGVLVELINQNDARDAALLTAGRKESIGDAFKAAVADFYQGL